MTIGDVDVKPPESLRLRFKKYQKLSSDAIDHDEHVVDFRRGLLPHQQPSFVRTPCLEKAHLTKTWEGYLGQSQASSDLARQDLACFESTDIPGLVVIPSLLPVDIQAAILDKTLHRDLVNPLHQTTPHLNYQVEYPPPGQSFFDLDATSTQHFSPLDPSLHKPPTVQQVLEKKLKWMTLGGQYDWSNKVYPQEEPPPFPSDLQQLLRRLFPDTTAEAAIVNLYSPGGVLRLHQDVSEFCDQGLISLSIGCAGLFMLALGTEDNPEDPPRQVLLRLNSGDAVYMKGRSRYAWHGVPMIIPNTCPEGLQEWPCRRAISADSGKPTRVNDKSERYAQWRGWLSRKRINLNVRQMFDHDTNKASEP